MPACWPTHPGALAPCPSPLIPPPMQTFIARFLGYDDVDSIDSVRMSFGADWAHNGPAWILFGCLALGFLAALFYIRYQPRAKKKNRVVLGFLRGFVLLSLIHI